MGEHGVDGVERLIADARRICEVPAPPFGEAARAELVRSMLSDLGVDAVVDAVGNVVGVVGEGVAPAEDAVVVAAHLDTVFGPETELRVVERDGRLAAPGIGDNSLAVAALLALARRFGGGGGEGGGGGFAGRAPALARPLVLAATVGEEGLGDLRGAKALLAERPCAMFVALEGMMLDSITVAAVGSVRLVVTVRGPGGHPWSDRGTPSAVHGLVAGLARAVAAVADLGVVVNVGVIGGGTVINAIASSARAEIDLRSEEDALLGRAVELVREAFDGLEDGLELDVEQVGHRPGGRLDTDHPLLAAARRARERAGLGPAPERASSTDANAALGRGIPALTVGVTTGDNAHRLDEYVDLAPVAAGMASVEALVEELVGAGGLADAAIGAPA